MELQISYSICAKVQKESILSRKAIGSRENTKNAVRMEESRNHRSRSMPGPCAYVGRDTTKGKCIKFYGIFKRKKQPDDI